MTLIPLWFIRSKCHCTNFYQNQHHNLTLLQNPYPDNHKHNKYNNKDKYNVTMDSLQITTIANYDTYSHSTQDNAISITQFLNHLGCD